ncbi:hypothetical protein H4R19_004948 [Coemansia spiralis]|nr:hypothetical protein H4R19_004948 [Coemansia spiralis]
MLRSKNLRAVLERALTRDILACAVFNAEGVVLAYAVAGGGPEPCAQGGASRRASARTADGGNPDRLDPLPAEAGAALLHTHQSPHAAAAAADYEGTGTDDDESAGSSLGESHSDGARSTDTRERLDDDLAIVASLWKSYENLPALVGSKDGDADEYAGNEDSDVEDDAISNRLHTVIIECEHGKAATTQLGAYRLFLLSGQATPLGMLKLKTESLGRFLEDCLRCSPR